MDTLAKFCTDVRLKIIDTVTRSGTGHIASALSMVEILAVLFNRTLSFGNDDSFTNDLSRDRFVLSKGHGALSLYAILSMLGYCSPKMETYLCDGSDLTAFPCKNFPNGLDFSSASLGHGLSYACGLSYGVRKKYPKARVFCVCSDGECQEGSIWEAAQFAGHHQLSNLIVIIDSNKYQAFGKVQDVINQDNINLRWKSFGFDVYDVDGHDSEALEEVFRSLKTEHKMPAVVLANTVKGKGISFMENDLKWHYLPLDQTLADQARRELLSPKS